jgi:glycosyltransferase involved in cell wall biosynthesis
MKRFVFDISTLSIWHRPPVGIVRTQFELAQWLDTHKDEKSVLFIQFSEDKKSFFPVDKKTVRQIFAGLKANTKPVLSTGDIKPKKNKTLWKQRLKFHTKRIIQFIIPLKYTDLLFKAYAYYRQNGLAQTLVKIFFPYYLTKKISDDESGIINALKSTIAFTENQYAFLNRDDVFVSVGLDWDFSNYELLFYLKKKIGFSFVGGCYDVIPITHPEYAGYRPDFTKFFFKYFYELNYLADRIFCISDFSKDAFKKLAKEHNIAANPELKTIYLGDELFSARTSSDNSNFRKLPAKYVLYVSTIESKKNHMLLLRVWLKAKEQNIDMPDLVCVGMHGWGVEELFSFYEEQSEIKQHVHFFTHIEDAELDYIYKNSLFCLFPSYIEGWGLSAAEALTYGKICIISSAKALQEATRGLMPSIEPDDVDKWMFTISELTNNNEKRKELEQIIATKFNPKSWANFAKEFFIFAEGK